MTKPNHTQLEVQLFIAIHMAGFPKGCAFVFFKQVCTNSGARYHKMETKLNKSEVR